MRTKILALPLLLLCIGGAFSQTTDEWYQNKPIRSISFEGLKNVSQSELDGVFASYIGSKFNDQVYWDILQKLYGLEYFDEINPLALPADPDKKTVQLQFTVKEKPVIESIKFSGNKAFRAGELLEKITLKEKDIYNEMKSRIDERAIRDFYLEKGYANVKVVSEMTKNDNSSILLKFTITEGKPTVISSILFEGNKVMASKTLKGILKLKEAKFLQSGTFSEATLEKDKSEIRSYYLERGYLDASVENVVRDLDTESNKDKNHLTLSFVIKEGDQYTYGGASVTGNTIFKTEDLLGKIRLKEGDVLNKNKFDEGFQAIADEYYESGYTSNYINKKENRDTEHKRVSYEITIAESERSHIEHIVIKGNTKTKDRVILREFSLEPGDIFSKGKLIDSVRNLYNLRYFSSVVPDLVQGSEQNLVDVVITLEEQMTASVQFGVTFSGVTEADSFPLSAFVQWEDKNFLGNGQTLSSNVTASPDTQSLTLGFAENWFLGSPLTASFNLSVSHQNLYAYEDSLFPIFSDDYYDENGIVPDPYTSVDEYEDASSIDDSYRMKYDQWKYGIGAATGYRWNPHFATVSLRGGVNFSVVQDFYDDLLYRPADKEIRDKHGAWKWNNSVWTRLSLDKRDLYYDPSEGWFASQQVTLYGLFPDIETSYYTRYDTKAEGYFKLLDIPISDVFSLKLILAGYSGLSFLAPTTEKPISDTNKLYVDGMFIGWGWSSLYSNSQCRGDALLNHTVELRMPIAVGVVSFDGFFSAVAPLQKLSDITSLSLNDYYFSFGPALRFSIQQFPLKLLLANTFRIQDGDFEWANGVGPDWKFVLSFTIANQ
jgi:outer membrane protein insertion porin family